MRILVAIHHYFGPTRPEYTTQILASAIEPIGRIAALNENIVALKGHFGPNRYTFEGEVIDDAAAGTARQLDIVVICQRNHNLLSLLGLAAGTFETQYVDGNPVHLPFYAQSLFLDRLGAYDLYCSIEDNLIIHDPAFFEKLMWFQGTFGPRALLAPVRFELASIGSPAKVIIEPELPENWLDPFRRANQPAELEGTWRDCRQNFRLPRNPHAGCYFLTQEQLAYWVKQPSFNDRDTSWVGPLESAITLSVGKVFDIYKAAPPDRFFLAIQHFGARYAAQHPAPGSRRGEPPLLAIAQNALRAAVLAQRGHHGAALIDAGLEGPLANFIEKWIAQGTVIEQRGQLDAMQRMLEAQQ